MLFALGYIMLALSVAALALAYPLYRVLLAVLPQRTGSKQGHSAEQPSVSVIIAAWNEDKVLGTTLRHLTQQDYPSQKMEILVGSDNSSDCTAALAAEWEYTTKGMVRSFAYTERQGKAGVVNALAAQARGSVLVFADANTCYEPQALRELVTPFIDAEVGGVCGRLVVQNPADTASAEQEYWAYESDLKDAEGKLGCVIGANGGIYAVRAEVFEPLPTDRNVADDLLIALRVLAKGRAFVYAAAARATEYAAPSLSGEYRRKVRITHGAWNAVAQVPSLLRTPSVASLLLYVHKIFRWLTPLWIAVALAGLSLLATESTIAQIALATALALTALTAIAWALATAGASSPWLARAGYVAMIVCATAHGTLRFLTTKGAAWWESTER